MFGKNSKMSWNANDKGCKEERIQVTKWFAYNLLFLQTGNTTPSKQSLKGERLCVFCLKMLLKNITVSFSNAVNLFKKHGIFDSSSAWEAQLSDPPQNIPSWFYLYLFLCLHSW